MDNLATGGLTLPKLFQHESEEVPFSYDLSQCNILCLGIILIELAAYTHHILVNFHYLHMWANFNVFLMLNTLYTAYLT